MKNVRKITNYHDERDFVLENAYGITVLITLGSDYFIHACRACKSKELIIPRTSFIFPWGKTAG